MLNFKPVELSDRSVLQPFLLSQPYRSADFNFANLFIWQDTYHPEFAFLNDSLIIRYFNYGEYYYSVPLGGDIKASMQQIKNFACGNGCMIVGIPEEHLNHALDICTSCALVTEEPASFDYIYSAKKLALLEGKKLHGKRNHINRFICLGPWHAEPITQDNISVCKDFLNDWYKKHDGDFSGEKSAIELAFNHYFELELEGIIIFSNSVPVAFAIGDRLSADTYDIHFEKADPNVNGAYTIVNREFARFITEKHSDILYINREDDMGIESLRKAKLSYYPDMIIKKYKSRRR